MVAANLVAITLFVVGAYTYLDYEASKTIEQMESLRVIENLDQPPSPNSFSGKVPDEIPEIYEDQLETDEKSIP